MAMAAPARNISFLALSMPASTHALITRDVYVDAPITLTIAIFVAHRSALVFINAVGINGKRIVVVATSAQPIIT